ncbi:MAG TPA: glycogen/starch synthase [Gemmatimonadales bacterium]|nr:glycogen/starch synthase [Gemmatimonadales bacterium]
MLERRSPVRGQYPHSALHNAAGEQVTVVHLAAEYYPYARSGGLAEAVANLARFQSNASVRSLAMLPLYRSARKAAGPLREASPPLEVSLNGSAQPARLLQQQEVRAGTQVYFVEADQYFDRERLYGDSHGDYFDNHKRYAFFTLAALEALPYLVKGPVLLHVHDWHAALALVYLRTRYAGRPFYDAVRTVLSVHNAGYQGHYPPAVMAELGLPWELFNWRELEWYGKVNLLKGGLVFADRVVTVSPNHARELRTPAGGFGLQEVFEALGPRFTGILNGIDQVAWDPEADPLIPASFTIAHPEPKAACKREVQRLFGLTINERLPVFAMAARLVTQKGIALMIENSAVLSLRAQFVFIGAGEERFEQALTAIAALHPDRIAVNTSFTDRLEHLLMAGADLLLMPCQYEPCGLTQMRSQRYGAIPVVRRVGGLADTVHDGVNGFVFEPYHAEALLGAALRGLDCYGNEAEWARLRENAMSQDFSWERSVERYLEVYRLALA